MELLAAAADRQVSQAIRLFGQAASRSGRNLIVLPAQLRCRQILFIKRVGRPAESHYGIGRRRQSTEIFLLRDVTSRIARVHAIAGLSNVTKIPNYTTLLRAY